MQHSEVMVSYKVKFYRIHEEGHGCITDYEAQEGFRAFGDYLKGYFDAAAIGWGHVFITPEIISGGHKIKDNEKLGDLGDGSSIDVDILVNFILDYEDDVEIPSNRILTDMLEVAGRSFILSRTKHMYLFKDDFKKAKAS